MKEVWRKWIVISLVVLAIAQLAIFGIDDCDACSFAGKNIKQFYQEYKEECLTNEVIDLENLTKINLTQVDPKYPMQNLSYKNENS